MNESKRTLIKEKMQSEHDSFRGMGPTISYFDNDNGDMQKVVIEDKKKVSKLRSLRNDRTLSLQEVGLPEEARLGRIDVSLVNTNKPEDVQVIFAGGIHADESESPSNWERSTSTQGKMANMPRAEIMEAHDIAAMLGRRDNLAPLENEQIDELQAEEALNIVILPSGGHMVNGNKLLGLDVVAEAWTKEEQEQFKQAMDNLRDGEGKSIDYSSELRVQQLLYKIRDLLNDKNEDGRKEEKIKLAHEIFNQLKDSLKGINSSKLFTLAKKINLNRQFPINEQVEDFDSARRAMTWPEARLLATATADLPNAKYIFSMHEDPEYSLDLGQAEELDSKEQGFYFYDVHYSYNDDPDKELVMKLKEELANELKRNGFYIKSGVDDPNDPNLGFEADHGYINQPIINKNNQMDEVDGTYETAMVALGQKGVISVERAFCFEIPGKISRKRKRELLGILQEKFILPFLKEKGLV